MTQKQALSFWKITGIITPLHVGIFNESYRVKTASGNFILQKLHPLISSANYTRNYNEVTRFLRRRGYPAQEVMPLSKGSFLVKDGDRRWRLLREIPGHVYIKAPDTKSAYDLGTALGKVHKLLDNFNGRLHKPFPMFQHGEYLRKLKKYKTRFEKDPDVHVRQAAKFLLENFPQCFLPLHLPKRVIHTDPKVSNFVFNKLLGAPVMIDFDTVQRLSPLYDVGDALRSVCGQEEGSRRNKFDMRKCRAFLNGYLKASGNYLSFHERKLIFRATALVILGLAARFLNDYIDDSYFGWDLKRYASRKQHNLARAMGQIALYQDFMIKMLNVKI